MRRINYGAKTQALAWLNIKCAGRRPIPATALAGIWKAGGLVLRRHNLLRLIYRLRFANDFGIDRQNQ